VLLRLAHLAVTNTFTLLRLLPMSEREKDIEILALRLRVPKTPSIACDVQVLRGSREPPVPPVLARTVVSPLLHRRDPTATVTAR
jgi:hypothetical protein